MECALSVYHGRAFPYLQSDHKNSMKVGILAILEVRWTNNGMQTEERLHFCYSDNKDIYDFDTGLFDNTNMKDAVQDLYSV